METIKPVIISSFGPPALACIRSWGRKGLEPGMVVISNPGETACASRYLSASCVLPRKQLHTKEGLKVISNFLASFQATGLFCIDENISVWLNENRDALPVDTEFRFPGNEMIRRSANKILQIETARSAGFEILPTYYFNSAADVNDSVPVEHFPLCLRPSKPDSVDPAFKVEIVYSDADIISFLGRHSVTSPIIAQPFVNLPNLVVHGARTTEGGTIGLQGFLVERKFQGVTLTIRPIDLEERFKQKCRAFTEEMDLIGHYHFEFLHDSKAGKQLFLEFNHRFGGTTAKVLACGYDEPAYALQVYGIDCSNSSSLQNVTVSSIKGLVKSGLYAMSGRLTPLDYPEESKTRRLFSTFRNLLLCRDEVFAWDDIRGTFAFYLGK